ncbi:hypothetical protein P170DRAFT_350071 [Aspergillus steynii IBT 23096]|uniref:Zn(2)-C6 fungal-type domain-containing protein n=1 Tax=Aspergillus steynii IBT 23096 TaxID=1392250 RepID=A0A2I2GH39_9EURO|nr:uncharacterized protein P170DRAFT_350071 [Aspergillus steynii IBT 23096]PLB52198.1 hypothetical protein P170DRAFT_350071 [Aspergillus steynii IBT 23096]
MQPITADILAADQAEERIPSAPKRRKVRKGTQSCWECKRRKIRCTFVTPSESVCDGCRSRQVKCVGQESEEKLDIRTDVLKLEEATGCGVPSRFNTNAPGVPPRNALHGSKTTSSLYIGLENENDGICTGILAAWPSQHDLDLITSLPATTSILFHGTVCMPYSTLLNRDTESPRDMLQLPSPETHTVLIARKLLMLGSFLQGIPSTAVKDLRKLESEVSHLMSCLIETASRLVTSDDDLVHSIEGIECIMIESMYHNNAGNLRRSWLLNRRAMTIAQMMGLHLGPSPSAKMLDIETHDRIDPQYMWFRLVISDRYLSLMLGLPQGFPDSPFATSQALESCSPLDRLERIEAMIGGLILQQNQEDLHNLELTHQIDKHLQDAAASMPAQWWLVPDISALAGSDTNGLRGTLRLMNQFTHYHLLAQLHLPYMLQPSTDRKYDYSKLTAVNASREILARFVLFRGTDMIPAYCRGIDFLTFIASTTLCLAHIDSRQQPRWDLGARAGIFDFLAHQRPGDRGLLERTQLIMQQMAKDENDDICHKIGRIIDQLLAIEESTPNEYSVEAITSPERIMQDFPCSDVVEDGHTTALSIQVPYFGTIKIEHGNVSKSDSAGPAGPSKRLHFEASPAGAISIDAAPAQTLCEAVVPEHGISGPDFLNDAYSSSLDVDDWVLQGVGTALFDSLLRGSEPEMGS